MLPALMLAACATGSDYKRPDLVLPESWPVKQGDTTRKISDASEKWWSIYADAFLDQFEDEALAHNADIQVAASRVLEVRAQMGIAEADRYPVVGASARQSFTEVTAA